MKLRILLTPLLSLFCLLSFAQSREVNLQEALNIVKTHFVGQDVDYYQYDVSGDNWAFFVDAEPMKGWEHNCYRYNIPKHTYQPYMGVTPEIISLTTPPRGRLIPLEVRNRYGNAATTKPHVNIQDSDATSTNNPVANRTYAIILNGGVRPIMNYERYWNDCSFLYQTLTRKYGIPKENVFPLMSDGTSTSADMRSITGELVSQPLDLDFDGNNEISLSATKANVNSTLNTLATVMQEGDHLLFYVIDHGGTDGSNSYICLWNNAKLYDYELATMLAPFTNNKISVNVVLGQCYSGGFISDLGTIGCVVSTACRSDESSYSCYDIPFDEFVYQWTTAINEATHNGAPVSSDIDRNGRVTMEEAFDFAKSHDRISYEHPQFRSNPKSIGEDLAFNYLAPLVDLYVKDNYEDTGKEPNKTTDKVWISPSIWIRNEDDNSEEHENPYYASNHLSALVYVKVYNRGTKTSGNGKYMHVYWAKASTGLTPKAWKGREIYSNGSITGEHLRAVPIPNIAPGDSAIVKINWSLPADMIGTAEDNFTEKHHFCLLARIMDQAWDDGYLDGYPYFDIFGSNDLAQKNVSIISREELNNSISVFVRNISNESRNYTLEFVPRTEADAELYEDAQVEMSMSSPIFTAWARGQYSGNGVAIIPSSHTVRLLSPESRLEAISMEGEEFDKVNLKVTFLQGEASPRRYTYDLIQRDENGKIIGGETFIIETPLASDLTINPDLDHDGDVNGIELNVSEGNYLETTWLNSAGTIIGRNNRMVLPQSQESQEITIAALTQQGELAKQTIMVDPAYGISKVSNGYETLNITLKNRATANTSLEISSVKTGIRYMSTSVSQGTQNICVNCGNLPSGLYVINYKVNGTTIDSYKFMK